MTATKCANCDEQLNPTMPLSVKVNGEEWCPSCAKTAWRCARCGVVLPDSDSADGCEDMQCPAHFQ
jgi:DNA-directed RNA polymerase subunit RPC12/RpoP